MLDKNTLVKITNRQNGYVGYKIPEMNGLRRRFSPGETKEVTMDELTKLSYLTGGMVLLKECFILDNPEAVSQLIGHTEPEYYYSEKDVENLLLNGSLDQLKDALDFAPEGVIELIKDKAVDLKLNDVRKRNAITEKTGFNVSNAIAFKEMAAADEEPEQQRTRRAAPITSEATGTTPQRRSSFTIKSAEHTEE